MKLLFTIAHGYLPQGNGGAQKSIDQLTRELMKKGHEVAVLASLVHEGRHALRFRIHAKLNQVVHRRRLSKDSLLGYPVWRTWFSWNRAGYRFPSSEIRYIIGRENPDLAVIGPGEAVQVALTVQSTGVPILMNLRDVEFQTHSGSFSELGNVPCVANSHFTAEKYRDAFGVDPTVIYPSIPQELYRTQTTKENVTFINPSAHKGLSIAIELARRCPSIPFVINENWPLTAKEHEELRQKVQGLANVTFMPAQDDMRRVYGKCKILLVPSLWEEAYGRVVAEAQISGIPVVASARGGLPETVGSGGILLDPLGPIDDWVNAVQHLWTDDNYYAALSAAALAHASRNDNNMAFNVEAWERVLADVASASSADRG